MENLIDVLTSFAGDVFRLFLDILNIPLFAVLMSAFVVGVIFLLIRKEF